MQLAQGRDMLVDVECDRERTIFEKPEQCILRYPALPWGLMPGNDQWFIGA